MKPTKARRPITHAALGAASADIARSGGRSNTGETTAASASTPAARKRDSSAVPLSPAGSSDAAMTLLSFATQEGTASVNGTPQVVTLPSSVQNGGSGTSMGRKESQRKPVPSLFTGVPRFEQTGLDLKAQFDKFEANLVATVPVPDPVPSESAAGLQQVVEQKVTLYWGEQQLKKSELKQKQAFQRGTRNMWATSWAFPGSIGASSLDVLNRESLKRERLSGTAMIHWDASEEIAAPSFKPQM